MRGCIESAGVKTHKVHTIQNWAEESITPVPHHSNSFRASQPWASSFVVLYSGNIGAAHDFTAIKEGTLLLAEDKDIHFVFIGSGPRRQELEEFAATNPHANITFLNYLPRNELAQSLSAGDVHLIAQADNMTGLIIPSKLYGILAAARPIVFTGPAQTEVARTIMDAGCGFVVANDDPHFFADRIRALKNDRATAEEMGKRGRDLYLRKYQRREATKRYLRLLQTLHSE
jgi:glycosyltransferase involved in cell wall biosynthesis